MRSRLTLLSLVVALGCVKDSTSPSGPGDPTPRPTRYVAKTGSNTGNDCTVEIAPCATVQFALNTAVADDIVQVAAGTYDENVTIPQKVLLRGAGMGLTVIRGGVRVVLTSDDGDKDTEIKNLSVRPDANSTDGLFIAMQSEAYGVELVDIQGFSGDGINIDNSGNPAGSVTISSSEISLNTGDGIHIANPVRVVLGDVELDGNGGDGVEFSNVTNLDAFIEVTRVKARFSGQAGIQIEGMTQGRVTIRDICVLSSASQAGFLMSDITGGQILLERSNLARNTSGGALIVASTVSPDPDLRNNWWGDATGPSGAGPGGGNSVSVGIRYSPFSATPFDFSTPICQ